VRSLQSCSWRPTRAYVLFVSIIDGKLMSRGGSRRPTLGDRSPVAPSHEFLAMRVADLMRHNSLVLRFAQFNLGHRTTNEVPKARWRKPAFAVATGKRERRGTAMSKVDPDRGMDVPIRVLLRETGLNGSRNNCQLGGP
jgi:hypothetical protein